MATWRFKAITNAGVIERGMLEAPSEAAAVQQLRTAGKFPVSTVSADGPSLFDVGPLSRWFAQRGQHRRLAMATQELASLLGAGVELDRALGILCGLVDIGALREVFAAVRARVRDGASLADAMADQPQFSKFYVSMVRSGEFGGSLDATMLRLSDYLQRSAAIRETITSALFYPAILMLSAFASISIILFFVLPEFEPMFAEAGREMPLPARIAMGASDLLRGYWWLIGAVVVGSVVWFRRALRDQSFRAGVHTNLLRLPVLGELLRTMEVERFMRSVGASMQSGVALPVALTLARDVLWNAPIVDAVTATATSLREGESLSARLGQSGVFPPHMLDIVRIGEETGKLGEMLVRQAEFDERRVRHRIDRLLSMLVPVLTILLGLLVGGLIATMMSAILSVNDLALQ